MNEEWRDVVGYEGLYQVSNLGRVKSVERTIIIGNYRTPRKLTDCIMALSNHIQGYQVVYLRKAGQRRVKWFVHRLVAHTFLENPLQRPYVNHLDRNRQNNTLANLEWATESENTQHWMADERAKKSMVMQPEEVMAFAASDLPFA